LNVWLLDVDGVLVQARGYRAAVQATVNYFSRRMGLGDRAPTLADIDVFEACGMINEWDSTPVCVAVLLYEGWRKAPAALASGDIHQAAASLSAAGRLEVRPDYQAIARRMMAARQPGEAPSRTVLRLMLADAEAARQAMGTEGLAALLRSLLGSTVSVTDCPTTFVFEQYSLGSQAFAETFGLAPVVETESLLLLHDRPALSPEWRERLTGLVRQGDVRAAIFTARPSRPPAGALAGAPHERGAASGAYAPEADLAAQLLGLAEVPLIGYGHIQWLADAWGTEPEALIKPSPVQALAALGAALTGDAPAALAAARALAQGGELAGPLAELRGKPLTLTVFEDTFTGIRSVRAAAELLRGMGVPAQANALGIAQNPAKRQALSEEGAACFDTLSEALEAAPIN
jgi:hypothetical protein